MVLAISMCALLPSLATAGPVHVGYIYKIEGALNGQRVVYVGSATSLKIRLVDQHRWSQLLRQKTTTVSYKKVYAELDIQASNQKKLDSARREALRSVEQIDLEKTRKQADTANLERQPGQMQDEQRPTYTPGSNATRPR